MRTKNPFIKHKVGLLNLAEALNNISKACKAKGISLVVKFFVRH